MSEEGSTAAAAPGLDPAPGSEPGSGWRRRFRRSRGGRRSRLDPSGGAGSPRALRTLRAHLALRARGVSERGAGSVLALGLVGAIAATAVAVVPVLGAHVASRRAANAADAAALAAADVLSGAVPGAACDLAAEAAARNGASLASCEADGLEASVSVQLGWPLGAIGASARAGPPPEAR